MTASERRVGREGMLTMLREAADRAARHTRGILASFTYPIERFDTVRVFTAALHAGRGEVFFWEQAAQHAALVGVGAVTSLETSGGSAIADAATAWRALLQDAVISYAPEVVPAYGSGPTLFGGFAFDPLKPRTALWEGFPDGLLVLPRLLLSYHAGSVSLTINTLVHASDDIDSLEQKITEDVHALFNAITATNTEKSDAEASEVGWIAEAHPYETHSHSSTTFSAEVHPAGTLSAQEWMQLVDNTVKLLQQGLYEKVVLARAIEVTPPRTVGAFEVGSALQWLRESYPGAYVFAIQRGKRFFVGATPERLVQAQDGHIQTMALAGSAPRGETPQEDARIGAELLGSEKNTFEHASVVAMVREALQAHCASVYVSEAPRLLKLKNIQHLETPIMGELLPGRCILDVMTNLHPTSAVGGVPRLEALKLIRQTEQLDRGWYAGPVGWIGACGHGEFAVGLRSGLVEAQKATLFAGCGIVAGSNPQNEYEESCLKLKVMLRGLGVS